MFAVFSSALPGSYTMTKLNFPFGAVGSDLLALCSSLKQEASHSVVVVVVVVALEQTELK